MIDYVVWFISTIMVIATVILHYEVIMVVSDRIIPWAQKCARSRRVMAYAIAGLLFGHILEIWLFALAMNALVAFPVLGAAEGAFGNDFSILLYLSSVNYTSLGDNGIRLIGPVRALAASESLVGMMMIAWSAAFAYLKMKMIWERRSARRK
ncbi:MAG: hypothetical protein WC521_00245 [Bdellovibrionales bacterium]|jgi:hypothetical protein